MEVILNQKSEFADLMSKIIASDLPEDNETWTIGKDYYVDMLFNGKDIRNTRSATGDYNFITGAELHIGLDIINLITATYNVYKMVKSLTKSNTPPPVDDIISIWSKRMEEEGISSTKATKIAREFSTALRATG